MRFAGPAADAFFARLEKTVDTSPKDADFAITAGGGVRIVSSRPGLALDVPQSAARILSAATKVRDRTATLVLAEQQPTRTTADAQAMGITGTVGSYETFYGGIANRIHNVQLVAHLVDHKFISPGETFSFNGTTGERSAAKGFLEAPVIVNGEVQTGLGGGVCQVSTTVFNAAYEAGLPITSRTNHALYISHYPLGRDATVDYPGVDLKFVNDTGHWLLLRTWVGSSSLTVVLYGAPQHRRVESTTAPLRVVSPPPVQKTVDATLKPGDVVVDSPGTPSQATSVERKVYDANGKLVSDATWYSSYRSEPKIVRVGPKKAKAKKQTATTVTTTTDVAPTAPH
jgi:vancomycin resistance protein YoaR